MTGPGAPGRADVGQRPRDRRRMNEGIEDISDRETRDSSRYIEYRNRRRRMNEIIEDASEDPPGGSGRG